MPNWCYSTLKITGPKDEITSIAETELDFEKILPTPAELFPETQDDHETIEYPKDVKIEVPAVSSFTEFQKQANRATYGHESWHPWRLANWGVKWPASNKELSMTDPQTINVTMSTPWGLPTEILQKLSKDHPNVTIEIVDCEEEAGFFVGSATIKGGKTVKDDIHDPTEGELRERGMMCDDSEDEDEDE